MKIVIVSNITNGIGLQRDYELLRGWLVARGHTVVGQQYDQPSPAVLPSLYDLGIFIETMAEHLVPLARRWWYFANPEWLRAEYAKLIERHCQYVLAKTLDAERVLRERYNNVCYTGFLAADRRDLTVPRELRFLHIGGNSGMRNTNAVLTAWREYRYWNGKEALNAPLTVISNARTTVADPIEGVEILKRVTEGEIVKLQNQCLFHLLPSAYEGYGQALHEAQSVEAVILTTGAGPMAELKAPFEVPSVRIKKVNLGVLHEVSPVAIREAVPRMLALPNHYIARMALDARMRYELGVKDFGERFGRLLEGITPRITVDSSEVRAGGNQLGTPQRIALLGNLRAEHSTENDLAWTLRDMGHQVVPFQEDTDTTEEVLAGVAGAALLIYVHTHGWETPGKMTVKELLGKLGKWGVKTASFHLDRYVGLNQLDHREDRVGQHAFWHTDYVFTADGGNQEFFRSRRVNHYWLPPAVVKKACERGTFRPELEMEVGFVGAEGYHPEYPFRGELIDFLRRIYGDKFKVFTGYRGQALNDLYASISIVVGDSCFGGADCYWSDRVPETLGRGGFLIHPASRGLSIPGLVTFEPGNLNELQDRIEYFRDHVMARNRLNLTAQNWVRQFESYHNRMEKMLRVCGVI